MTILIEPIENKKHSYLKLINDLDLNLNLLSGPWIAGGSCRLVYENKVNKTSDIDIFCKSIKQFEQVQYKLKQLNKKVNFSSVNKKCEIYNYCDHTIQIIIKEFHESIETLFETFDFNICKIATDGISFAMDYNFISDSKNNELTIEDHELVKINRLRKYCGYGYTPSPGLLARALSINDPNLELTDTLTYALYYDVTDDY